MPGNFWARKDCPVLVSKQTNGLLPKKMTNFFQIYQSFSQN